MEKSKSPLGITDVVLRDGHQSLLATRLRLEDMLPIAPAMDQIGFWSIESWGGATFDACIRYLGEDPWERIRALKKAMPNTPQQMLLRGQNILGYRHYADDVVEKFVERAAENGVDVFRVFDAMNDMRNIRVALESVKNVGKHAQGTLSYTISPVHTMDTWVDLGKQIEDLGAHSIAIKDMAGLVKPNAIKKLVKEIKQTTDLPIHFHTHDTSGTSSASVLAAIEEKVDIVDLAIDSMSGLTSQPALGSIVSIMKQNHQDPQLDEDVIRTLSLYWEQVRQNYHAFETDFKGGSSDVYLHQMPGGQFTNLKEQARSLGITTDKWGMVANKYAEVNQLFGDIVKVTPSSKIVGDMALYMIANDLSKEDIIDSKKEISFPESVIEFFKGEIGIPHGGFPKELQKKVLGDIKPLNKRPGEILESINLDKEKENLEKKINMNLNQYHLASYLMYPKVFKDFIDHYKEFSDTSILSTELFFYGPQQDKEYTIEMDKGKNLILRYLAKSEVNNNGKCSVFFEINGQPRTIDIENREFSKNIIQRAKADDSNNNHVGSPLPGQVAKIFVKPGNKVIKGDKLLVIEAMKMETTINAEKSGTVKSLNVSSGDNVETKDLLVEIS